MSDNILEFHYSRLLGNSQKHFSEITNLVNIGIVSKQVNIYQEEPICPNQLKQIPKLKIYYKSPIEVNQIQNIILILEQNDYEVNLQKNYLIVEPKYEIQTINLYKNQSKFKSNLEKLLEGFPIECIVNLITEKKRADGIKNSLKA